MSIVQDVGASLSSTPLLPASGKTAREGSTMTDFLEANTDTIYSMRDLFNVDSVDEFKLKQLYLDINIALSKLLVYFLEEEIGITHDR